MARNVEIKARVDSIARWNPSRPRYQGKSRTSLEQDDTFFTPRPPEAARAFADGTGELIFYRRAIHRPQRKLLLSLPQSPRAHPARGP